MNRLDWLEADAPTWDWPPDRNAVLEAAAREIASEPWVHLGVGLHVPAAAIAPGAIAEIPIDPTVIAAIARGASLDWWELRELETLHQLQRRGLVAA